MQYKSQKKRKSMENVGKHRDIKLVTRKKGRNYCLSESSYHTAKFFIDTFFIDT